VTRARRSDESGVTLVETAVVLLLTGIILAFAGKAFVSLQSAAVSADTRLQNLDEARVLINTLSKDIRTAAMLTGGTSPFVAAEPTRVVFYGNLNAITAPNKIEIYLDSTDPKAPVLIEKITKPDPGSSPPTYLLGIPTVRLVGKYVTNTTASPLFIYYDTNIAPITPGMPLSAANMLLVRSVGITLLVRKSASASIPSTTLANRVRLPNVYFSTQSGT
jgi:hypothetical protein